MTTTEKRKYHTIRVPVKKTSSEYYAMLRRGKIEPEKYCAYCGARLHRKYNEENGRWEDWSHFLNRKCCDNSCAQKLRFYGKHEDVVMELSKRLVDGTLLLISEIEGITEETAQRFNKILGQFSETLEKYKNGQ